jgi:hypothetical protein
MTRPGVAGRKLAVDRSNPRALTLAPYLGRDALPPLRGFGAHVSRCGRGRMTRGRWQWPRWRWQASSSSAAAHGRIVRVLGITQVETAPVAHAADGLIVGFTLVYAAPGSPSRDPALYPQPPDR